MLPPHEDCLVRGEVGRKEQRIRRPRPSQLRPMQPAVCGFVQTGAACGIVDEGHEDDAVLCVVGRNGHMGKVERVSGGRCQHWLPTPSPCGRAVDALIRGGEEDAVGGVVGRRGHIGHGDGCHGGVEGSAATPARALCCRRRQRCHRRRQRRRESDGKHRYQQYHHKQSKGGAGGTHERPPFL